MLPHKKRLNKAVFEETLKNGYSLNSKYLSIKVDIVNKGGRFAVVVSKKVAKTSVARNKLRRQGYYLFKKYIGSRAPKINTILFIKKKINFKELEGDFLEITNKPIFLKHIKQ